MPRIRLTPAQITVLDALVLQAVKDGCKESGRVVAAAGALCRTLPDGKTADRYVDGSLQRLRKRRLIEYSTKLGWTPYKTVRRT